MRAPTKASLRATLLVGVALDLTATNLAGGATAIWAWALALVIAAATALWPDSLAALLLLGLLLGAWLGVDDASTSAWILLGMAGVVGAHVAVVLLSQGPREARIAPALVRLWVRRASCVWSVGAALWLAGRIIDAPGGSVATSAVLTALLVVAAAALWLGGVFSTSRGTA